MVHLFSDQVSVYIWPKYLVMSGLVRELLHIYFEVMLLGGLTLIVRHRKERWATMVKTKKYPQIQCNQTQQTSCLMSEKLQMFLIKTYKISLSCSLELCSKGEREGGREREGVRETERQNTESHLSGGSPNQIFIVFPFFFSVPLVCCFFVWLHCSLPLLSETPTAA